MTRRLATPLLVLTGLLGLVGCGDDVTEIVLEVRSDLSVPEQLDAARIEVRRPMGEPQTADADLTGPEGGFPRTLAVVHRGGPLGPVEITVTGLRDGAPVVARELVAHFEKGESLRLVVRLQDACIGRACPDEQTCEAGACRDETIAQCEYEGRTCSDAGLDGGTMDAEADAGSDAGDAAFPDGCPDRPEQCNDFDDDCDGLVDEDFDLLTDPDNCGRCGRTCPDAPENGTGSTCEEGACVLQCDPGFGDCNRDPVDGCETDTDTDMMHCGGCGMFCPGSGTFHATDTVCTGGRCIVSCDDGWGNCNDDPADGCEQNVRVDREHCGTCDNPCEPGQMCNSGVCG